jgi:hypothetical protein
VFKERSVLYFFLVYLLMFIFCILAIWKFDFCTSLSFVYRNYIPNNFGCLEVSIRVTIGNIFSKPVFFPDW